MKRKIRVIKEVKDIYPKYKPKVGSIYDADYSPARKQCGEGKGEFCVLDILDKKIILRSKEFELVEV